MLTILDRARALPERRFAAGETILQEGAKAGVLYVLAAGAAEVVKGDIQITTVSDPGSVFGEMSILLDVPHTATVRALRDSVLHVASDPAAFLQSDPAVPLEVAKLLGRRLQLVTSYLSDIKRQYGGRDDHLGVVDEILDSLVHHQGAESRPGSERYPDPSVD